MSFSSQFKQELSYTYISMNVHVYIIQVGNEFWGPFFFLLVVCIDLNHPRTAKSSHDFTLCSYSPQAQNQQKRFIQHCVQE